MAADHYESSDSIRHSRELKYARQVTFNGSFALEHGGELPEITVVYEVYGELNDRRDNAVLVCHAISGDSHVAQHEADDDPGWWDILIGPGQPLDTRQYFVICPNILGGCRGSTGPASLNPVTGKPYGPDFPLITVNDIVRVQAMLIDHLGIERLLAVIGGSLGGHMALTWAVRYPERMAGTAAIATSPRLTSQALAFDVVARNAILHDPDFMQGHYYESGPGPKIGLAIARMLGHITYLSRESMMSKFDDQRLAGRDIGTPFETRFAVGSYLAYQGDRFGERFDANTYLLLSMAMDLFDMGGSVEALREAFRSAECRWLVISYSSDWLFPPFQSQQIVDALVAADKRVSFCNIESGCGHDAFLLPDNFESYGPMLAGFLANLNGGDAEATAGQRPDTRKAKPTSIFHNPLRLDYETIAELIPEQASVLDLGCGTGGLLSLLRKHGHHRVMGVELDEHAVVDCVRRGLDVLQADLNKGLAVFADGYFDFVVLSQTLQTIIDVRRVINEMLRVGKKAIVSFPNLGYHKLREQLAMHGRAPLVAIGGGTRWYDTHNVRFLTIADFEEFCRIEGIRIHEHVSLDTETGTLVEENPNLNADLAILVLSK